MSDLTITASNVKLSTGTSLQYQQVRTAAVAITAGQAVYLNAADGLIYLADANASDVAAALVGVALANAAIGQPIAYATDGADVDMGSILSQTGTYILSATAGAICPVADLASSSYLSYIGYAVTPSKMRLMIKASGVLKP